MQTSASKRHALINLALIGCGQIARLHAQRIQADGRGQMTALFDPNLENAARIQTEFAPAAQIFSSFDALVQASEKTRDVDAAIICTPTHRHFEDVRACRNQDWPVLCEKPLAETRARIEQLISETQTGGPLLSVAYQRRYQAAYRTLR
ncbi:MAG: iolG, partial [Planctomycetaceae bacterium]|nr:iolG [Planctomycetaceae bacterium]